MLNSYSWSILLHWVLRKLQRQPRRLRPGALSCAVHEGGRREAEPWRLYDGLWIMPISREREGIVLGSWKRYGFLAADASLLLPISFWIGSWDVHEWSVVELVAVLLGGLSLFVISGLVSFAIALFQEFYVETISVICWWLTKHLKNFIIQSNFKDYEKLN